MLQSLSISNFILIGSLETSFPEGLVIISGETGAGKSILLGALSLVLGAKADASMVGPRGENCIVEAVFGVDPEIRAFLEENDLPCADGELVLRRVVAKSGRSRSFANDEPVSLSLLQDMAGRLVDIHSQHQTLRLQDERFRMEALDLYAGCVPLRQSCSQAWGQVLSLQRELEDVRARAGSAAREQDYNQAQWEQLDRAQLQPGEVEELEIEQKQLAHAEEIKETLCAADTLLSADGTAPSMQLREVIRQLEKGARFIPSLGALAERLVSARVELDDIADEISALNQRTEVSPARLEAVEERLSLLYGLMKKHGVASVEELIAQRDRLADLLGEGTSLDARVQELEKELDSASERHLSLCGQLHEARLKAAAPFGQAIEAQLKALELDHAAFEVSLQESAPGMYGADKVQFLFASARGAALRDVAQVASGGELSRIMLSLKATMARFKRMPTLVFDEIDSGVSGSVADKMGSLVCGMGRDMQVFAITHLPQVAAKGSAHYLVTKSQDFTSMHLLDHEGRVQELARMLSGASITPAAVANARVLLDA